MPDFGASLIAAASAAASAAATAYAAGGIFTFAANAAFSIATSALMVSLQSPPKPSDRNETLKSALAPRHIHFGRTLTTSALLYDEVNQGTRWQVIGHNHGPVSRVLSRRFDNEVRSVTASGAVLPNNRFYDAVYHQILPGTVDQAASQLMLSRAPYKGNPVAPGWTQQHRLQGIMASVLRCNQNNPEGIGGIYPTGRPPQITLEVEAGLPFDPRSGQNAYVDNGALWVAYLLTHEFGNRIPNDRINWESLREAANIADALGWSVAGAWSAGDGPKVPLANMLAALDGALWIDANGLVNFKMGVFEEPDIQITSDHILGVGSISTGAAEGKAISEFVISHPDRAQDYATLEVSTKDDSATFHSPTGLEMAYLPFNHQAKSRSKRELAKTKAKWLFDGVLNLYGLKLINKRFFELHLPEFGIINEPMELEGWAFDTASAQVSITARSVREADFPVI